jgi:hypothetical protein
MLTWGQRTGIGMLETAAFGPHQPSALTGLLAGAVTSEDTE